MTSSVRRMVLMCLLSSQCLVISRPTINFTIFLSLPRKSASNLDSDYWIHSFTCSWPGFIPKILICGEMNVFLLWVLQLEPIKILLSSTNSPSDSIFIILMKLIFAISVIKKNCDKLLETNWTPVGIPCLICTYCKYIYVLKNIFIVFNQLLFFLRFVPLVEIH